MGRRLLRYLLIGLVLLLLGGLWAFSFFLFNPFEGRYEYPVASLIPREVDFYAGKNRLADDFDPFPRLAFQEAFAASPGGKALLELGLGARLAEWRVEEQLAELERALAELPVSVDPLRLFGGRSLALAGNFAGPTLAEADWAVYGRTGWLGKLAVALVGAGWIDLAAQGLQREAFAHEGEELGFRLSGGTLTRPLYVARLQDVLIVATRGELLVQAHALDSTRGQDSLDRSAKYVDNVVRTGEPGDELELYVDQRALAESLKVAGTWPDPRSNELGTALAAKLFQLGAVREALGTLDFGPVLSLDLTGELSSNVLTPFQQRLYDARGFDKEQMLEAASLVHSDAGLFAYLHVDVGDLLRELRSVVGGIDPAAITNLEDFVRQAFSYPDLDRLIDDIDAALRDRVALFVREYDYPEEVGERAPPHDATPVYAWALVLWVQDADKVAGIRRVIERDDVLAMLRIQGATAGSSGLWDNVLQGGARVKEYWNALIPGTGHVATLDFKGRETYLVLSNENRLLGQVFKIYATGRTEEGYTRLADDVAFKTWVMAGLGSANALVWLAPRTLGATARRVAAHEVGGSAADHIDWTRERPRIEREVLARDFPGETWPNVSDANRTAFDETVQREVDAFQARYLAEHQPQFLGDAERRIRAWELLQAGFLQLATDRKRMRLHARLRPGLAEE
ncbi:MAG TPA: hypothetical protein VF530_09520 [Planctomycetota bacterium]